MRRVSTREWDALKLRTRTHQTRPRIEVGSVVPIEDQTTLVLVNEKRSTRRPVMSVGVIRT